MIPYGRQDIQQADIDAVINVLKSDFLTQGVQVPAFEEAVRVKVGGQYAIAVNSATSALHLACLSLGVDVGDTVWTSPITFVASANCARYCGANVDFVDIDPQTYNMSVRSLEKKLEKAEQEGILPKVVIPVHLCGQSCQMKEIHNLAKHYGFSVIEDASHAIGGKYLDEPVGNCRYSDIAVFSFHPVKIITTAEGGVALTNDSTLADRMELLRSHGVTRDPTKMTHCSHGNWYYQQIELGFNYRMTDIQAALGISQLKRLDAYVKRRHDLARRYDELLSDMPLVKPWQHPETYSGLHLYVIRLQLDRIHKTHKEVFDELREQGIGVNVHYIPVHTQPYYKELGFSVGDYPEAERYYQEAISLPMYPNMSYEMQDNVIKALYSALR